MIMEPDDPRHGTHAGYVRHLKLPDREAACASCRAANAAYQRQLYRDTILGRPRKVSAIGARRRVQALQRLGWSLRMIADEAGWRGPEALQYVMRSHSITRQSDERIRGAYERLCMKIPPYCSATVRARLRAERAGFPPPLAWDNIDDPDEQPRGYAYTSSRPRHDLDPAVVQRILDGDMNLAASATVTEKNEVMRRWLAMGRPEAQLCELTGWKDCRYGREGVVA